jgi:membrane-associated phospholipid phosphatase
LGVLVPFVYVVWLVKRGEVTDIDVRLRKQRARPLAITILCTGIAWIVLMVGLAPTPMTVLAGAMCVLAVTVFVVTLRWKISVHSAAAAGAMTMMWAVLGTPLPLVVVVPLVAWSRVRLQRHTLLQAMAGAVLGLAVYSTAAAVLATG